MGYKILNLIFNQDADVAAKAIAGMIDSVLHFCYLFEFQCNHFYFFIIGQDKLCAAATLPALGRSLSMYFSLYVPLSLITHYQHPLHNLHAYRSVQVARNGISFFTGSDERNVRIDSTVFSECCQML